MTTDDERRQRHNAYTNAYRTRQRRAAGIPERQPAQCGTVAGYHRHRRTTHTEPCQACRQAWADHNRAKYQAKQRPTKGTDQ